MHVSAKDYKQTTEEIFFPLGFVKGESIDLGVYLDEGVKSVF